VGKSTVAGWLNLSVLTCVFFFYLPQNQGPVIDPRLFRGDRAKTCPPTLVNLALSFARRGIRTGILDTDIFGPSIPTLLNLSGEPRLDESRTTPLVGSKARTRTMY